MSAKPSDLARIQTVWDLVTLTQAQIEELGFDRHRFLEPADTQEALIAGGLMNRVFRCEDNGLELPPL